MLEFVVLMGENVHLMVTQHLFFRYQSRFADGPLILFYTSGWALFMSLFSIEAN